MNAIRFHRALKRTAVFLQLLVFTFSGQAQCDLSTVQYEDSICTNVQQILTNDSVFSGTIGFDPSHELFYAIDSIHNFDNVASSISGQTNTLSCVQDTDGEWYCFVKAPDLGSLVRLDYGSSLNNTPTLNLVNLNSAFNFNTGSRGGIRFVRSNGTWYGLSTLVTARLAIMTFNGGLSGSSIDAEVHFDAVLLPNPADLDLEIVDDSIIAVVLNSNGQVSAMNLGATPSWPPEYSAYSDVVSPLDLSNGRGVEVINDCGEFHVFAAGITRQKLNHLNYGTSLFNTSPTYTVDQAGVNYPTQIRSSMAAGKWQVWVKHRNIGFTQYQYNEGLLTIDSLINYDPASNQLDGDGFDLLYDNGRYKAATVSLQKDLSTVDFIEENHGIDSILWGDSVVNIYDSPGLKNAAAIYRDTFGIYHHHTYQTFAKSSPVAHFDVSGTCESDSTFFIDQSTGVEGIELWNWDFGDLSTSSLTSPAHQYQDTGLFQVTLELTDSNGCQDVYSSSVYIAPTPIPQIYHSLACQGRLVELVDSSSHLGLSTLDSSIWIIDDSILQTGFVTNFLSLDSNERTVRLITISDYGCTDSIDSLIDIRPSPVVDIQIDSTCFGDTVQFQNSTISAVPFSSFWSFGDGNTTSSFQTSHYYPDTGNYELIYAATTTGLCSDTFRHSIRISEQPLAIFSAPNDNLCTYEDIAFIDNSLLFNDTLRYSLWVISGDSAYGDTFLFSSNTLLSNEVLQHEIMVGTSCKAKTDTTISLIEGFNSQHAIQRSCVEEPTLFANTATLPAGQSITSSAWSYGDGATGTTFEPTHIYADTGFFRVEVTHQTDSGCTGTWDTIIRIASNPTLGFLFQEPLCSDQVLDVNVEFSVDPYDELDSLFWVIAGDTVFQNEPLITDTAGNGIAVSRYITTQLGCMATLDRSLDIGRTPLALIDFDTTCANQAMQLSDAYTGSNYDWRWRIDDDFVLFIDDPTFTFREPGIYPVSLEITENQSGCSSSTDTNVVVSGFIDARIDPSTLCKGERSEVRLNSDLLYDEISSVTWIVNEQSYDGDTISPLINTSNTTFSATAATQYGCTVSLSYADSARTIPPLVPTIELAEDQMSALIELPITDWLESATLQIDDRSFDSFPVNAVFDTPGFYPMVLAYSDTFGCSSTYERLIAVGSPQLDLIIQSFDILETSNLERIAEVQLFNASSIPIDSFHLDLRGNEGFRIRESFDIGVPAQSIRNVRFRSLIIGDNSETYCAQVMSTNGTWMMNGSERCARVSNAEAIGAFFPNPANASTRLVIDAEAGSRYQLDWTDGRGIAVRSDLITITPKSVGVPIELSLSSMVAGVYLVRLTDLSNPNLSYVRKLVIY